MAINKWLMPLAIFCLWTLQSAGHSLPCSTLHSFNYACEGLFDPFLCSPGFSSPRDTVPARSKDQKDAQDAKGLKDLPDARPDSQPTIAIEAVEDSDFVIKKPTHTIQLRRKAAPGSKALIDPRINSRKAWLFSIVVPGLGQVYNHSYFKIPIIYGLFITLGVFIGFNQQLYQEVLTAYKIRLVSDQSLLVNPTYDYLHVSLAQLVSVKDFYRRNRDLSIIATAGVWAINAIDAFVVSELKGFDVSNDLSLRIRPRLMQGTEPGIRNVQVGWEQGLSPGLSLTLNFKH